MPSVFELRVDMLAHGYQPLPCNQKKYPTISGWQNCLVSSPEEMSEWQGPCTGMLTANTPTFDIDILDPEVADAVEHLRSRVARK